MWNRYLQLESHFATKSFIFRKCSTILIRRARNWMILNFHNLQCDAKGYIFKNFFSDSFTKFCTFNILDFWGKDGDLKLNKFSAIFKFWDPFSETFSLSCLNYNSETLDWLFSHCYCCTSKWILEHNRNQNNAWCIWSCFWESLLRRSNWSKVGIL